MVSHSSKTTQVDQGDQSQPCSRVSPRTDVTRPPSARRRYVPSAGQRDSVGLLLLGIIAFSGLALLSSPLRNSAARVLRTQQDLSFEGLAYSLKGKKVVMIGDSLMRYKFITLVSFIDSGVKLSTLPNGNSTEPGSRNPVDHRTWKSWLEFNAGSLTSASCDCWHGEGDDIHQNIYTDISENRHYLKDGFDISFHQYFMGAGSCTMAGWVGEGNHSLDNQPYDWCNTFTGFMDYQVQYVHPDVVLLNTGAWQQYYREAVDEEFLSGLARVLPRLRQVVWLKTTQNDRPNRATPYDFDEPVLALIRNSTRHSIANTWDISTQVLKTHPGNVYTDDLHAHSFVYELMLQDALSFIH